MPCLTYQLTYEARENVPLYFTRKVRPTSSQIDRGDVNWGGGRKLCSTPSPVPYLPGMARGGGQNSTPASESDLSQRTCNVVPYPGGLEGSGAMESLIDLIYVVLI